MFGILREHVKIISIRFVKPWPASHHICDQFGGFGVLFSSGCHTTLQEQPRNHLMFHLITHDAATSPNESFLLSIDSFLHILVIPTWRNDSGPTEPRFDKASVEILPYSATICQALGASSESVWACLWWILIQSSSEKHDFRRKLYRENSAELVVYTAPLVAPQICKCHDMKIRSKMPEHHGLGMNARKIKLKTNAGTRHVQAHGMRSADLICEAHEALTCWPPVVRVSIWSFASEKNSIEVDVAQLERVQTEGQHNPDTELVKASPPVLGEIDGKRRFGGVLFTANTDPHLDLLHLPQASYILPPSHSPSYFLHYPPPPFTLSQAPWARTRQFGRVRHTPSDRIRHKCWIP